MKLELFPLLILGLSLGSQAKNKALVLGNQNYGQAPLTNALNDAAALSSRLRLLGFSVRSANDTNLAQLGAAVETFVQSLRDNDVALVYYSGRGFQSQGENYLIPLGFTAETESDAREAAYPVSRILNRIAKTRPRLNILILDSCRDNPFLPKIRPGWAAIPSPSRTLVALATSPGSTANDNPASINGLFARDLLVELKSYRQSLQELFDRVRENVYRDSNWTQLPWTAAQTSNERAYGNSHY